MNDTRIPKLVYEYTPIGRRNLGRPRKWWTDQEPWRCKKCKMDNNYMIMTIIMIMKVRTSELEP